MRAGLFFLPFIAIFFGLISSAVAASNPGIDWVMYVGWGLALLITMLWIFLDLEAFKRLFQTGGGRHGMMAAGLVLATTAVLVGVCMVTSRTRFNKSYDVSKEGLNSLSDQSKKLVEGFASQSAKVKVTGLFVDQQAQQKFRDLLYLYQKHGEVFEVSYVDPRVNHTVAQSLKLSSPNTVILNAGAREARFTEFTEEKFTNALVSVSKDKAKKIYFSKGHGEPSLKGQEPDGFDILTQILEADQYLVEDFSFVDSSGVPADANLVVIAGPKSDLSTAETTMLIEYVKKGGALLVAFEGVTNVPNLISMVGKIGVKVEDDLLILPPEDIRARLMGSGMVVVSKFDASHPATRSFGSRSVELLVRNARSMSISGQSELGLKASLVGETSEGMYRVNNVRTESDLKNLDRSRIAAGQYGVFAVASGKISSEASNPPPSEDPNKQSNTPESRVVVAGSASFAGNQMIGGQSANKDMFVNTVNYLLQDEDFISIRPKESGKGVIEITSMASQFSLLFVAYLYPLFFFAGALFFWLVRRSS